MHHGRPERASIWAQWPVKTCWSGLSNVPSAVGSPLRVTQPVGPGPWPDKGEKGRRRCCASSPDASSRPMAVTSRPSSSSSAGRRASRASGDSYRLGGTWPTSPIPIAGWSWSWMTWPPTPRARPYRQISAVRTTWSPRLDRPALHMGRRHRRWGSDDCRPQGTDQPWAGAGAAGRAGQGWRRPKPAAERPEADRLPPRRDAGRPAGRGVGPRASQPV